MKESILATRDYIDELISYEMRREGGYFHNCTHTVEANTESDHVNAGSVTIKMDVYNKPLHCEDRPEQTDDGTDQNVDGATLVEPDTTQDDAILVGSICASLYIAEHTSRDKKTDREFVKSCAIFVNNNEHLVIWDKISKDAVQRSYPYIIGWLIGTACKLNGEPSPRNIAGIADVIISGVNKSRG